MRTLLTGGLLVLVCSSSAFAECQTPRYRVGKVYDSELSTISIPITDFLPARLVCLAERLKRDHRGGRHFRVLIFSSHEAAKCYHGPIDIGDRVGPVSRCGYAPWSSNQLHAIYHNRLDDDAEFVSINPVGGLLDARPPRPGETRIDLPAKTIPRCQFEVNGRCVVAMDYPNVGGTYRDPASGSVTLTARFTRRGLVDGIRIGEMRDMKASSHETIVRAAIENLKTWRLEPAPREDTVRITYTHVDDRSLPQPGQVDIQFDIPRQITIRARAMP